MQVAAAVGGDSQRGRVTGNATGEVHLLLTAESSWATRSSRAGWGGTAVSAGPGHGDPVGAPCLHPDPRGRIALPLGPRSYWLL